MSEEKTAQHSDAQSDAGTQAIDAETLQRLRELRTKRAAERPEPTAFGWLPLVSSISLAMFVVGVMFYVLPREPSLSAGMEHLDMLTAEEEFEFFQNVDFYAWLMQQETSGAETAAAAPAATAAPGANAARVQPGAVE